MKINFAYLTRQVQCVEFIWERLELFINYKESKEE